MKKNIFLIMTILIFTTNICTTSAATFCETYEQGVIETANQITNNTEQFVNRYTFFPAKTIDNLFNPIYAKHNNILILNNSRSFIKNYTFFPDNLIDKLFEPVFEKQF